MPAHRVLAWMPVTVAVGGARMVEPHCAVSVESCVHDLRSIVGCRCCGCCRYDNVRKSQAARSCLLGTSPALRARARDRVPPLPKRARPNEVLARTPPGHGTWDRGGWSARAELPAAATLVPMTGRGLGRYLVYYVHTMYVYVSLMYIYIVCTYLHMYRQLWTPPSLHTASPPWCVPSAPPTLYSTYILYTYKSFLVPTTHSTRVRPPSKQASKHASMHLGAWLSSASRGRRSRSTLGMRQ